MNARVVGALTVLRTVADRTEPVRPLGVGEIAAAGGSPLSSVSRWCADLERLGLLERGPGYGSYVLGRTAVRLSGRAAAPYAQVVRRVLTRAAQQTGETVCLAAGIDDPAGVRTVASVGSAWTLHAPAEVGSRLEVDSAILAAAHQDGDLFESTVGRTIDVAAPVLDVDGIRTAVVAARTPVNRRRALPHVRTAVTAARSALQRALAGELDPQRPPPLPDPAAAGALDAALAVLQHLTGGTDTVAAVARGTGLRQDRTQRLLEACVVSGLVRTRPQGTHPVSYELNWSVHAWYRAATPSALVTRGGPLVAAAADDTGACAFLTVLHGLRSLTVVEALEHVGAGLVMTPWLGRPHPVVGSDGGPTLVSDFTPEEVVELLGPRHSRYEIDVLTERMRRVARDGVLATESPEDGGLSSFSAPVRDAAGSVVAAACLVGPLDWARGRAGELRGAAQVLAQRVSEQLDRPAPPD